MNAIQQSIWTAATERFVTAHEARVEALIASMVGSSALEQNQAEVGAIRSNNLATKLGKKLRALPDAHKASILAAIGCQNSKELLEALNPSNGRFGGWQQHCHEHLPTLAAYLAGDTVAKPDKPTEAYWPILCDHLNGKEIDRALFERKSASGFKSNYQGMIGWITDGAKGFGLLTVSQYDGKKHAAWKLTDKGIGAIGRALKLA